jgi:ATP-dependent DNA helicase RecQ
LIDDASLSDGLRALGHDAFRPGQREAVDILLKQRRLLLVAPTGGGKSLIYQLPATLFPGTTLVVSPLVALMQDQVGALEQRGVAATFLAATLDSGEVMRRMHGIAAGRFKLAYVAPERLTQSSFRSLVRDLECPLVAVDEAHCISEWGHDFRPEYLQIGRLLSDLAGSRVLACTATATPVVRDEILERLGLDADTPQLVRGFARPNLSLRAYEVASASEREHQVDDALAEALGAPGAGRGSAIVYSPTRKATESECARLARRGWNVAAYHAGLDGRRRADTLDAFAARNLELVVATNAFGMGIDRADVRAVIHLAPPGSIEAYYQEVGRAGRDGDDALGLMLISPADLPRRRHLLELDAGGSGQEAALAHKWGLFLELMRWAEGGSCRHDAVLRYFGDEAETLAGCGRCDVCMQLGESGATGLADEEASLVVRKCLSAVARLRGRFGLGAAVALLRGVADPRLARSGLDRTPTYGCLRERREEWLTRALRRCVTAGWVDFEGGERPVVVLTEEGGAVMRGDRPVRLLLPEERSGGSRRPSNREERAAASAQSREALAPDALDAQATALFDRLRSHRLELARDEGVPPYVIASDRTLRHIALLRPRDDGELARAHGIGPAKLERYGSGFLTIVNGP